MRSRVVHTPAARRLAAVAASLLVGACGDSPTPPEPTPLPVRPEIVVSATSAAVGDTIRYWIRDAATGDTLDLPGGAITFSDASALWPYMWDGRLVAIDPGALRMIARHPDGLADTVDLEATQRYGAAVAAGGSHSCALSMDGRPYCWGEAAGAGYDRGDVLVARWSSVARNDLRLETLAAGRLHNCGLTASGEGYCWGGNPQGQVGRTNFGIALTPLVLVGTPTLRQVAGGDSHGCALTPAGEVLCWGSGANSGATGDFDDGDALVRRAQPGISFASLGDGSRTQCALEADGRAWCWGRNGTFQLGRGTPGGVAIAPDPVARPVATTLRFVKIASGTEMTCGITTTATAACWGAGFYGDGTSNFQGDSVAHAVEIPGAPRLASIAVEGRYACALEEPGRAWCWGESGPAGMGDGERVAVALRPVAVGGALRFRAIDVGVAHGCGAATDGYVYCWGENGNGQLGTGDRTSRTTPVRVAYQGQ